MILTIVNVYNIKKYPLKYAEKQKNYNKLFVTVSSLRIVLLIVAWPLNSFKNKFLLLRDRCLWSTRKGTLRVSKSLTTNIYVQIKYRSKCFYCKRMWRVLNKKLGHDWDRTRNSVRASKGGVTTSFLKFSDFEIVGLPVTKATVALLFCFRIC